MIYALVGIGVLLLVLFLIWLPLEIRRRRRYAGYSRRADDQANWGIGGPDGVTFP